MGVIIDGFDFQNAEAMKYWSIKDKDRSKSEMNNMIFSGDYILSRKIDGNWFMIIKDNDGTLYTRPRNKNVDGEYPNKIEWIPHIATELSNVPNGTVLLGEIYLPSNEKSKSVTTILGCLKNKAVSRQEKGEKLHFYIFDCLAFNGKNISMQPLEKRILVADWVKSTYLVKSKYIKIAQYITNPAAMLDYISLTLASGGEGVVLQRKNNEYEYGKRTAHHSLKIKQEIENEIDCFVTGNYKNATFEYTGKEIENWNYWYDQKTGIKDNKNHYNDYIETNTWVPITKGAYYGWAGSIELGVLDDNNNVVPIAWISNVSDTIKQRIVEHNDVIRNKVVKLSAMERDAESGMFRHARIVEWRDDKDYQDCRLSDINV